MRADDALLHVVYGPAMVCVNNLGGGVSGLRNGAESRWDAQPLPTGGRRLKDDDHEKIKQRPQVFAGLWTRRNSDLENAVLRGSC